MKFWQAILFGKYLMFPIKIILLFFKLYLNLFLILSIPKLICFILFFLIFKNLFLFLRTKEFYQNFVNTTFQIF